MGIRKSATMDGAIQEAASTLGVNFKLNTHTPEQTGLKAEVYDVEWKLDDDNDWKPCFPGHRYGHSVPKSQALALFKSWCMGWQAAINLSS